MFRYLFLLFLLVPLIEIYFLIQVGRWIGAGWTVFFVVATAVVGVALLKQQGIDTLQRAQQSVNRGGLPAVEMLEGVALVFSGAFLLTPGFVTDTLGFVLLVPPLRRYLIKSLMHSNSTLWRGRYTQFYQRRDQHGSESTIIEGEIVDEDDSRHLR
jgi:UPF0716 protein FxsA